MDIDTDFSAHARAISIQYVKEKYGERAVANIMTKGKIAAKKALEYAPKLLGVERFGEKAHYTSLFKEMRKLIGDEPNAKLSKYEAVIRDTFANNPDALKILDYAMEIEGYTASYGTHAAGVIITDGSDVENYIPLMKVKDDDGNEVYAVQADMVQCEAQLGFIKMDFLGLKNLNIITDCMHLITERYGIKIDPYHLPFETEVFERMYADGDTDFVFQFESDGMKKMLKQFHPTSFMDVILLVACYRPGPMDFIPNIIESKNTGKPSDIVQRIPVLEPVLKETYGYPVYQEEVMKIMTTCASFTMGQADNVRRHMSKKHEEELAAIRPDFVAGCAKNNISAEDANWLYDQLMPFAKYGFNKSHAAAYSLVSYITAWLKFHYPAEYISAAINTQGEKTVQFTENCKARDFKIYRPDINKSRAGFIPFDDGILIGLAGIKGMKSCAEVIEKERNEHGLFKSLEDFVQRVNIKSNDFEKCVLSGACDDFTNNRKITAAQIVSYKKSYDNLMKLRKTIEEKETLLSEKQSKIWDAEESVRKTLASTVKKIEKTLKEKRDDERSLVNDLKTIFTSSNIPLSTSERLAYESELLDMWVTGNPLEDFSTDGFNTTADCDEAGKNVKLAGIVTTVHAIQTKSGSKMAFLKVNDRSGQAIDVVVFPSTYDNVRNLCEKGCAVQIAGKTDINSNGDEDQMQIIANDMKRLSPRTKTLFVSVDDIDGLCKLCDFINKHQLADGGVACRIYNKELKEIEELTYKVDPQITSLLEAMGFETKIKNIHNIVMAA